VQHLSRQALQNGRQTPLETCFYRLTSRHNSRSSSVGWRTQRHHGICGLRK